MQGQLPRARSYHLLVPKLQLPVLRSCHCMDAGGTTPRMEEVEQCMEQLPRASPPGFPIWRLGISRLHLSVRFPTISHKINFRC
jgi:hypothetical protein